MRKQTFILIMFIIATLMALVMLNRQLVFKLLPIDKHKEPAGKYGFINRAGDFAIKPQYDCAQSFKGGFAGVGFLKSSAMFPGDCLWGFIDKTGEKTVDFKFDRVMPFRDGVASVCTHDRKADSCKWGAVDGKGRMIVKQEFANILNFSDGLAAATKKMNYIDNPSESLFHYIDKNGRKAFKGDFADAGRFSGLAAVVRNGKWGYIDKKGKWVSTPMFTYARPFKNGLAAVGHRVNATNGATNETFGFINESGNIEIDFKYCYAQDFDGGYAFVRKCEVCAPEHECEWGYTDRNGEFFDEKTLKIKIRTDELTEFKAKTSDGNIKYGLKDNAGRIRIKPVFDSIEPCEEAPHVACLKGKCGFINNKGSFVLGPEASASYDCFSEGLAAKWVSSASE